ncbi:MAG: glycosyltransferase family 39 protein [Polyangiaceae bacterium]|jgi:hypothetical protein
MTTTRSPADASPEFWALASVTFALTAVHLYAATRVGFGDAEALYACYALHPFAAYLDHPGLIGVIARLLGGGSAPTPEQAHVATSLVGPLVPWAIVAACRASGAGRDRAFTAGLVVATVPEVAIGLFAMTPDLPLALAWIGAIAFASRGLRSPPQSAQAFVSLVFAGLLAGVSVVAKVSGALLFVSLAASYVSRPARAHAKTPAPWLGLAIGMVVVLPVVLFEAHTKWPLLRHRWIDTQSAAHFSLRNAAALVGGQLFYLSPLVAVLAAQAARTAWRNRFKDAVGVLLFASFALPAAVLVPLCLWSSVAEPHWLAPAFLSLVPAAARAKGGPSRRLVLWATALGAAIVAIVHLWVLVPDAVRLAPRTADVRLDLTNELYGWPQVIQAVRREAAAAITPLSTRSDVIVVGPHWVICAQLEAALRGDIAVGCDTPIPDDFDGWWPRSRWRMADSILWVTDARFGPPHPPAAYATERVREINIVRGGRIIRTFTVSTLKRVGLSFE